MLIPFAIPVEEGKLLMILLTLKIFVDCNLVYTDKCFHNICCYLVLYFLFIVFFWFQLFYLKLIFFS